MKKKVTKYIIFLLLIPLIVSFTIAIMTNNNGLEYQNDYNYNGIDIPEYKTNTKTNKIKTSNTYIYASVFTLVCVSSAVLIFIKKKRGI